MASLLGDDEAEIKAFIGDIQEQEAQVDYTESLWDQDAIDFWNNSFGNVPVIRFKDFIPAFKATMAKINVTVTQRDVKNLRRILDHNRARYVSVYMFSSFLDGNGPFNRCIEKMNTYCTQPWFHWYLSHDECTFLLTHSPPGTFIARFSRSNAGHFAFALKRQQGSVNKFLMRSEMGKLSVHLQPNEPNFDTLPEFIKKNKDILSTPYTESWPTQSWFRGFLTEEETLILLTGAKPLTFLARIGNRGHYFVMVHVDQEGEIIRARVVPRANGGFSVQTATGKREFPQVPTLEAFVQRFPGMYRYPLKERSGKDIDPNTIAQNAQPNAGTVEENALLNGYGMLPEPEAQLKVPVVKEPPKLLTVVPETTGRKRSISDIDPYGAFDSDEFNVGVTSRLITLGDVGGAATEEALEKALSLYELMATSELRFKECVANHPEQVTAALIGALRAVKFSSEQVKKKSPKGHKRFSSMRDDDSMTSARSSARSGKRMSNASRKNSSRSLLETKST
eukprot:CAMPEP_0168531202 /NCGR_PEP_ID=MMETSP0405-20121227/15255_1 /TAXON_ID=498012 /ORGANISM="Trichosphaerium sp, Strain Am-I-7 wt" /LENGTH=507 /DNA_ID=CAMNT_0008555855 /DNA_START=48 /DNA_END=1568 /DNA_ORIENTATION=+